MKVQKALKRTTPVETGTVTTHDARTAFGACYGLCRLFFAQG